MESLEILNILQCMLSQHALTPTYAFDFDNLQIHALHMHVLSHSNFETACCCS